MAACASWAAYATQASKQGKHRTTPNARDGVKKPSSNFCPIRFPAGFYAREVYRYHRICRRSAGCEVFPSIASLDCSSTPRRATDSSSGSPFL
eukprot:scaffold2994_cov115-Pinguiococcus_pyrenoidosus.AAC.1